jgi:hypothetical protein
MSIINFDELKAYMGGNTLSPNEKELCENIIIPGIQEELEIYLNTKVELVQVRESLQPECDGYVYFTIAPVKEIISAIWSGTGTVPLTINQYVPDPPVVSPSITRPVINRTGTAGTDYAYRLNTGYMGLPGLYGGGMTPYMVMDYIAGYDCTNDNSLKMALLRVTSREVERQFDTTAGIRSGTLENVSESDLRPKGWTREELKAFDRLKRRVIM